MQDITNSPITDIKFNDFNILVKRDDLLDKDFSGNKARKFYYYLQNDFPNIDTIVSYGSNQSNAMYSLSVLAKLKDWKFIYYTYHIPKTLQNNPDGNYKAALTNGMDLRVDENFDKTKLDLKENELFIDEGGAIKEASFGIKLLAKEIEQYKKEKNIKDLEVFLPSGTGTTALYLQKFLNLKVLTTPCVGDDKYLKQQWLELEDEKYHPTILTSSKKYHFGKLYKENYILWKELKEKTDIEFDLLYDPIGWRIFLDYLSKNYSSNTTYLYIHQGGILGNSTMIKRYKYKYYT